MAIKLQQITPNDANFNFQVADVINKLTAMVALKQDLASAGVITVSLNGKVAKPATSPSVGPAVSIPTPSLVVNFSATGAFASILLQWNVVTDSGHAYVEIWRNTIDDIASAVFVGSSRANLASDTPPNSLSSTVYYYWARSVNDNGVKGSYNAIAGTVGSTANDPSYALELLTGQITNSQLNNVLSSRIDLIDTPNTGLVSTTNALMTESTIKMDVNGKVAGVGLMNSATAPSAFEILADKFSFIQPTQAFQANASYVLNDRITPSSNLKVTNPSVFYKVITAGTAGVEPATWANTVGQTVISGGVTFEVVSNAGRSPFIITSDPITGEPVISLSGSVLLNGSNLHQFETGVALNNTTTTLFNNYKAKPNIMVSPHILQVYNQAYKNSDQQMLFTVNNIIEGTPGSWSFTPKAELQVAGGTGNSIASEILAGSMSGEYATAAAVNQIDANIHCSSVEGTGISGQFYRRQIRWRVKYTATQGAASGAPSGIVTATAWQTKDIGASTAAVQDVMTVNMPSGGVWYFVIEYIAERAIGTFGSPQTTTETATTTWTYPRASVSGIEGSVAQLYMGSPPLAMFASTRHNFANVTVPLSNAPSPSGSGWNVSNAAFTCLYSSYAGSINGGNNEGATVVYDSSNKLLARDVYSEGSTYGAGVSVINNILSYNMTALKNIIIAASGATSQYGGVYHQSNGSITLDNISLSINWSRVVNVPASTAITNSFTFNNYNFTTSSVTVIDNAGTLNYIAVGL